MAPHVPRPSADFSPWLAVIVAPPGMYYNFAVGCQRVRGVWSCTGCARITYSQADSCRDGREKDELVQQQSDDRRSDRDRLTACRGHRNTGGMDRHRCFLTYEHRRWSCGCLELPSVAQLKSMEMRGNGSASKVYQRHQACTGVDSAMISRYPSVIQ